MHVQIYAFCALTILGVPHLLRPASMAVQAALASARMSSFVPTTHLDGNEGRPRFSS